ARPLRGLCGQRRPNRARGTPLLECRPARGLRHSRNRHTPGSRPGVRRVAAMAAAGLVAACVAPVDEPREPESIAVVQPVVVPTPQPIPTPAGPTTFLFRGELTQGGWIRGQVPAGTETARLGDRDLSFD